jgi:predicted DNA-binding transcriptional regulator YafY
MARSGRLIELVHLLAGRRGCTIDEIASRFEISPRTAYRDLAELSGSRIPVVRDERGYRLLEGATLRPLNLTSEERGLLRVALGNPALRERAPLRRQLQRLEAKLDAVTAAVEESPEALRLAGVDRSGAGADAVLDPLRRAIEDRVVCDMLYTSLSGGTRCWRGVDPYRLFERSESWYLVGRCHVHDEPRLFRLDRIGAVRRLGVRFEIPASFDLDAFLADSWSVLRGGELHEVVIHLDPTLAPLVRNARHHASEVMTERPDGGLEYRARLSHLDEIARWVLGFGGRARAIEPLQLVERVLELAEEARRAHSGASRSPGKRDRRGGTDRS